METKKRCGWCEGDALYESYHDNEWGVPLYDDEQLFEFLILETFQAGLSWITILRKRENFREAFDNFDYKKVADYSDEKIQELMNNSGIIRNQQKIRAAISNAQEILKVSEEFGSFRVYIDKLLWDQGIDGTLKALKKRFSRVGPATGMMFLWSIGEETPRP